VALTRLYEAFKAANPGSNFYLIAFKKKFKPDLKLFREKSFLKKINSKGRFTFLPNNVNNFLEVRKQIKQTLKQNNINFIMSADYLTALSAISVSGKHAKVIFTFHGTRSVSDLGIQKYNYRQIFTKLFEKFSWSFSNAVIVPSLYAKQYLLTNNPLLNPKKIYIVQNIVTNCFYSRNNKVPVGRHVILYAGRLFEYKGVLNLIKAFAKFIQTNSKALLFVVYPSSSAEPGMERKMISLIKHLGVKKNTRIKKDPPKHNLIQYYKNSDVLVLPSKLENSPLVVLESLASGTPVIGTPVGNLKELLGKLDSTLILKNDSPEEILLKLNTFFSMPTNNRKVLGKRSIKLAKRFSEAQALASFGKVIKNIYL